MPLPLLARAAVGVGKFAIKTAPRAVASRVWRGFGGVGFDQMARAKQIYRTSEKPDEWQMADLRNRNNDAMIRLVMALDPRFDTFAHSISVKIVGGPASDLRRVYYLAMSTAFGRWSRAATRIKYGYSEISCHTDVTHKTVTVTVGYRITAIGSAQRQLLNAGGSGFGDANRYRTEWDVIHEGPDQVTVGTGWVGPFAGYGAGVYAPNPALRIQGGGVVMVPADKPVGPPAELAMPAGRIENVQITFTPNVKWIVLQPAVLRVDPVLVTVFRPFVLRHPVADPFRELPRESGGTQTMYLRQGTPLTHEEYTRIVRQNSARLPILPDDGRVITTGETQNVRIQPPRPPVDGITRGGIVSATVQSLTNPGFLPALPALTETPLGAGGWYVWQPGTTVAGQQRAPTAPRFPPATVRPDAPSTGIPDPKAAPLLRN